jgi:hypothetical protein
MILIRPKAQDRIKHGVDDQALRSIDEHILGKHERRPALDEPFEQAAGDQLAYHAILGLNLPLLDRFEPASPYLLVD